MSAPTAIDPIRLYGYAVRRSRGAEPVKRDRFLASFAAKLKLDPKTAAAVRAELEHDDPSLRTGA